MLTWWSRGKVLVEKERKMKEDLLSPPGTVASDLPMTPRRRYASCPDTLQNSFPTHVQVSTLDIYNLQRRREDGTKKLILLLT